METLSDLNTTTIYPFVIVSDPSCKLQDTSEIVQNFPVECRALSKHKTYER